MFVFIVFATSVMVMVKKIIFFAIFLRFDGFKNILGESFILNNFGIKFRFIAKKYGILINCWVELIEFIIISTVAFFEQFRGEGEVF
jgi:hypothetical protein